MNRTMAEDVRSLPNLITLSRLALLVAAALIYFTFSEGLGILLAVVAGVTDYVDGMVARRTNQVTRLGEVLDQFSDMCFESLAMTVAVARGFFPPIALVIYLYREFWVTTVRRFMAHHQLNIPTNFYGKLKTNFLMWCFLPTFLTVGGFLPMLQPWMTYVARFGLVVGLGMGYVSGFLYTRAFVKGYDATSR
jgi:CDP-diacylglycerol--glycerol-3-phosphate 3-phosphatidyltransferase